MARALLVGCGCRGLRLAELLVADGWLVRGTTRSGERLKEIESAGIEGVVADPDRIATLVDDFGDVAVVAWLLGSATGADEHVRALHGARLERLCEELVDTPVRGVVYEGAGSAPADALAAGREVVTAASERWRIRVEVLEANPSDADAWARAAAAACGRVIERPASG